MAPLGYRGGATSDSRAALFQCGSWLGGGGECSWSWLGVSLGSRRLGVSQGRPGNVGAPGNSRNKGWTGRDPKRLMAIQAPRKNHCPGCTALPGPRCRFVSHGTHCAHWRERTCPGPDGRAGWKPLGSIPKPPGLASLAGSFISVHSFC